MARSSIQTIIPLDRFARVLGINPLHFNQVASAASPSTLCSMPITQYAWQDSDRVGREEIAFGLREAENEIGSLLGFDVDARWNADEKAHVGTQYGSRSSFNARGYLTSVQTQKGYVITGGQEARSLIQAARPVVYSDADGDGYKETATITATTTVTDEDEIAIYYPSKSGANIWEIRPLVSVSIAAGVATIVARREQFVLESLQEAFTAESVNGDDDANFLATVDVYRHYNDPSVQVQFQWETAGCVDETGFPIQTGFFNIRDHRNGIIIPRSGDWVSADTDFAVTEWVECRPPDHIRLWYKAGWTGDPLWERIVCQYALSLIDRPICGCDSLNHVGQYWREDLAEIVGGGSRFQLRQRQLDNPLGTSRAAIEAWKLIERYRRYA